jgi:hypothetical protein
MRRPCTYLLVLATLLAVVGVASGEQPVGIAIAPIHAMVGASVRVISTTGGQVVALGPLPMRHSWRVRMQPNGARYVGRFSFPLAGRYQLAVAGRARAVVRVQGGSLVVGREQAPRYDSSPGSVLPAALAQPRPGRIWWIGAGGGGQRFVWFATGGPRGCTTEYLTQPEGWAPITTVTGTCGSGRASEAFPALAVASGQGFLVATVTTAADELRIVPSLIGIHEVVRSIPNVGPIVAPGRRLVLLSLGTEGMLRVIALRGGQILATA